MSRVLSRLQVTYFFGAFGNQTHFFYLVIAACIHLWNSFSATVKHRCNCESRSSVTCYHVRNNRNNRIRVRFEELSTKGVIHVQRVRRHRFGSHCRFFVLLTSFHAVLKFLANACTTCVTTFDVACAAQKVALSSV